MEIYKKIKQRRLELGLTLEEVAKVVGVSKATVSRWESGEITNMRRDRIANLAKVLNVEANFIMGISENNTYLPQKSARDLMIEKYHLNEEELAEYDRITKLSIEMNALMFNSNNIELEESARKEMNFELSETLKKAFISSLITKRQKEKKR